MSNILERLDNKRAKDLKVLGGFISIYCRENHRTEDKQAFSLQNPKLRQALDGREPLLCRDCGKLLSHGIVKLLLCPYDPKPMCKKCETPCYAPGYREKVRKVMRFSGMYLIKRGRLDLIMRYLF